MHRAIPRLITERPHDDARVVLIALHHTADARHPRGPVCRVVTQGGIPSVTFRICFVNDIEAQLIT